MRPTSDRVREAVFNALDSLGGLAGATVVDLFAGSGAMGLEAWSRGAAAVTFVERDRRALAAIRANCAAVGAEEVRIVAGDAASWAGPDRSVDVALVDPPYDFGDDAWLGLLGRLRAELVVAESDREVAAPPGWEVVRCKAYGRTVVSFLRPPGPPPPGTTVSGAGDEGGE